MTDTPQERKAKHERVTTAIALLNEESCEYASPAYEAAMISAWANMSGTQKEVLKQVLLHGPTWDGDIASKAARGDLLDWGLATRCCYKGEQGYTVATYLAYSVHKRGTDRDIENAMRKAGLA